MRAVRFDEFGPPTVLAVADIPTPVPAAGEVLVRVAAASINPSDVKNVAGAMHQTKPPRTPGRDFAGTVVIGPAEWVGIDVFGTGGDLGFTRDGTHAEFVTVPVGAVVRKPAAWSMQQAAAVGLAFVTAHAALQATGVRADVGVLFIGAGGVGGAAIQIASLWYVRIISTTRRADQVAAIEALGADNVIVLGSQPLPQAVRGITGGAGIGAVVDTVSGPLFKPALQSLADRGQMAVMTVAGGMKRVEFDLMQFYRRQLRLTGVNTLDLDADACGHVLRSLSAAFDGGQLLPAVDVRTFPLDRVVAAYEAAAAGGGKVVLTMG